MKYYGRVVRVNKDGRFLFIEREDGSCDDLFAHVNDFMDPVLPLEGDRLEFSIAENHRGLCAKRVKNLSELERQKKSSPSIPIDTSRIAIAPSNKKEHSNVYDINSKVKNKREESPLDVKPGYHFYIVFNPMLNSNEDRELNGETQAHSFYKLLCQRKEGHLYWGKYKSSTGNKKLDVSRFQRCIEENKQKNQTTLLYISDFHHFWAAEVEEVVECLDKQKEGQNTLEFYRENWDRVEMWFKVTDMYLVSSDPKNTNNKIKDLVLKTSNNLNTMDTLTKEVEITPYTSNLRYPLIVENKRFEDFFANKTSRLVDRRNPLLDDKYESEKLKNIVYSYVIPEEIFSFIPAIIRNEIILTEMKLSDGRIKTRKDEYNVKREIASDYIRILERAVRDLVFDKFYSVVPHRDFSVSDEKIVDFSGRESKVTELKSFSLGKLPFLMKQDLIKLQQQRADFYNALRNVKIVVCNNDLIDIRNSKVHVQEDDKGCIKKLEDVRRIILGVGYEGLLNQLYFSFYKERLIQEYPVSRAA